MKISIITPIYNESSKIADFLQELEKLSGDFEVLFADGGSTDDTVSKIPDTYRVIPCGKGRAVQMNTAAREATGDYLWFVHCDSRIPEDALQQINGSAADFGCFHIGFDYDGPFMGCNTFMSNRRAIMDHIAFGDQGIWIRRELFLNQGGFPELPIMEDYEFSRQMKRQKIRLKVLPGRIITSGRRYQTNHPLKTMWSMIWLRHLYRNGMDIQEIARRYKDIR